MISKYDFYRIFAFVRARRQKRLCAKRTHVTFETFVEELGIAERYSEIARAVWDWLVDWAFVPDFRPAADDDLIWLYGVSWSDEIEYDDHVLLGPLKLNTDHIDFTDFDGSLVTTPRDLVRLLIILAESQNEPPGRRFGDLAKDKGFPEWSGTA